MGPRRTGNDARCGRRLEGGAPPVALILVAWHARHFPAVKAADVLAMTYAAVIVVYWAIPQDVLGGEATARGELLALRHHLFPVAAYALGRLAAFAWEERGRVGGLIAMSAVVVAVVGLADLAFISLQAWRDSGVPGWYREQLGLDYEGLSGLPENWVFNTGDEDNPIRRLVSTFLSPLASAYALVVALIYVVSRPFRWWWGLLALLLYVALLFTHTRAALAALAFGLVVLALAQRRIAPAVLAAVSIAAGALFLSVYPSIGPSTRYTPEELEWLRENAQQQGDTSGDPFAGDESSTESHWRNLRDGARVVLDHPQGYGLGNAGVVAKRTGSRSAPASRRTRNSGSMPEWQVSSRSSSGASPCLRVCGAERRGWSPHSPPCSDRPADGRHRDPLDRVHRVGRGGARARPATHRSGAPRRTGAAACGAALVRVVLPLPSSEASDDRCQCVMPRSRLVTFGQISKHGSTQFSVRKAFQHGVEHHSRLLNGSFAQEACFLEPPHRPVVGSTRDSARPSAPGLDRARHDALKGDSVRRRALEHEPSEGAYTDGDEIGDRVVGLG